jgi:uncharacterized protein (DUF1697 family)
LIKLNDGTYCLFLRGINVGGHGRLPMADLKAILVDLGAREVRTYIQSGNAVFRCPDLMAAKIPGRLEEVLAREKGITTRALLLGWPEVVALMEKGKDFSRDADPRHLHVFMLARKPSAEDLGLLKKAQAPSEEVLFNAGAIFLHAPDGVARSKFPTAVDKVSGGAVTCRNWRTLGRVRDLAQGLKD